MILKMIISALGVLMVYLGGFLIEVNFVWAACIVFLGIFWLAVVNWLERVDGEDILVITVLAIIVAYIAGLYAGKEFAPSLLAGVVSGIFLTGGA